MAIEPRYLGAKIPVTYIAVGPSAPPMMAIEPASFVSNPRPNAAAKVAKIPICAAAPSNISLGLAIRYEKSVIAPIPKNTSGG